MPAPAETPPAESKDKAQGDEGTTAESGGTAATGTAEDQPGTKVLTLTQDQLDAMIERRLAKARDPEQEKKAKAFDDLQAQQQTDQEKAEQRAKEAEETAAKAIREANLRLLAAELRLQAAAQGARPEAIDLVVAQLLTSEDLEVTDAGQVKGSEAAVKTLLQKNPYLKAETKDKPPESSGGDFRGTGGATIDDQIAELEEKGDWKGARRLKLRKYEAGKTT